MEALKGVFGLANAPRLWWRRLREILTKLGHRPSKYMPCLFLHLGHTGRLQSPRELGAHVGDLIAAGDGKYQQALKELWRSLSFGKWESGMFECTGRHVWQDVDGTIYVSQPGYAGRAPLVSLPEGRNRNKLGLVDKATRRRSGDGGE